jgi:hypothetical protein
MRLPWRDIVYPPPAREQAAKIDKKDPPVWIMVDEKGEQSNK